MTADDLTLLERRKIEGEVLIPMVQAFQRAIGKERANEIAHAVILEFARASGAIVGPVSSGTISLGWRKSSTSGPAAGAWSSPIGSDRAIRPAST